jgi:hypothetical protein
VKQRNVTVKVHSIRKIRGHDAPFFLHPILPQLLNPKEKRKKESHFLGWRFYGYKVFDKNTILPIGGWRFFSKPVGLDLLAIETRRLFLICFFYLFRLSSKV